MSQLLIQHYLNQLADLRKVFGTRTDAADDGHTPKPTLKADKQSGRIHLDSRTALAGIPPEARDYKFGNRSALEWILDQYKEKKLKTRPSARSSTPIASPTTKEEVIDLFARVTTVSVRTQQIVGAMKVTAR